MTDYDLKSIELPRMAGLALRTVAAVAGSGPGLALLGPTLRAQAGLPRLRAAVIEDPPAPQPQRDHFPHPTLGVEPEEDHLCRRIDSSFAHPGVGDYARAYRSGAADPRSVADAFLRERSRLDREFDHRAVREVDEVDLRSQAEASQQRLAEGRPRSIWEGVPVAIKDELDVDGLHTRVGTTFLGHEKARSDAHVVHRLRQAGALIVGKAAMHEIGLGVTGLNPHDGSPKNPFDPSRHTGGSSSGSASMVASGLVPVAIGADGGGSIRVPAGLCGAVGLKATWGRISEHGAYPLCWSVGHVGPIGDRVGDVALAYALLGGELPSDPATRGQPPPRLGHRFDGDVSGLRVGVFPDWNGDAEEDVVAATGLAIDRLKARGARVVEVTLPGLELARIAHAVTITAEMCTGLAPHLPTSFGRLAADVRINLAIASTFSASDYVQAQRVRASLTRQLARIFASIDVLLTPTTARTAPPIHADAAKSGESDLRTLSALMRYVFVDNLSGWPALTVPVGLDRQGLPVGLQLHGRPWDESLLLHVGDAVERDHPRAAPKLHARVLPS